MAGSGGEQIPRCLTTPPRPARNISSPPPVPRRANTCVPHRDPAPSDQAMCPDTGYDVPPHARAIAPSPSSPPIYPAPPPPLEASSQRRPVPRPRRTPQSDPGMLRRETDEEIFGHFELVGSVLTPFIGDTPVPVQRPQRIPPPPRIRRDDYTEIDIEYSTVPEQEIGPPSALERLVAQATSGSRTSVPSLYLSPLELEEIYDDLPLRAGTDEEAYDLFVLLQEASQERRLVTVPLAASTSAGHGNDVIGEDGPSGIGELLQTYREIISDQREKLHVSRDNVLEEAMVQTSVSDFNFKALPKIRFRDESALDFGGPRREFFRLLMRGVQTMSLFEGPRDRLTFSYTLTQLLDQQYYRAGQMVAWSILHSGQGLCCLHPMVYSRLVGLDDPPVCIEDVPDLDDQEKIRQLSDCESEDSLSVVKTELLEWLCQCGVMAATIHLKDKSTVVRTLIKHHLYFRVKAMVDQFASGLESLGLLSLLQQNPKAGERLFVFNYEPLTAAKFTRITNCKLSPCAEEQEKEWITIASFRQLLQMAEAGTCPLTLEEILEFMTGSDSIPPGGFDRLLTLKFHNPKESLYPVVSTCSLDLSLPYGMESKVLVERMVEAVKGSPGFGLV